MNYACAQFLPKMPVDAMLLGTATNEGVGEESDKIQDDLKNLLLDYIAVAYSRQSEIKELRFAILMDVWKSDTCIISSDTDIAMHPAYQEIIGMGSDAIPMILEELEREPDNWFWALKAISSEDPTPHSLKGNIQKMTEAWLNWGRENNYIKLRHV